MSTERDPLSICCFCGKLQSLDSDGEYDVQEWYCADELDTPSDCCGECFAKHCEYVDDEDAEDERRVKPGHERFLRG